MLKPQEDDQVPIETSKDNDFSVSVKDTDSFLQDIPVPAFAGFAEVHKASNTEFPQLSFEPEQPLPYTPIATHVSTINNPTNPHYSVQTTNLDELEYRLSQHIRKEPEGANQELVLPDVPHTQTFRDMDLDDFDLPEITPGHSSFTSSIR